jgi:hypothetical protein
MVFAISIIQSVPQHLRTNVAELVQTKHRPCQRGERISPGDPAMVAE